MEELKEHILSDLLFLRIEGEHINARRIAKEIAYKAHHGQCRDNGREYITHPENIIYMYKKITSYYKNNRDLHRLKEVGIPTTGIIELAYLHDVVEDTPLTHDEIKEIFHKLGRGKFFDKYLDTPLKLITHNKSDSYDTYLEKVMEDPISSFLKMLDLMDNSNLFGLSELNNHVIERTIDYIRYFRMINDKFHYLEKLNKVINTCRLIMFI